MNSFSLHAISDIPRIKEGDDIAQRRACGRTLREGVVEATETGEVESDIGWITEAIEDGDDAIQLNAGEEVGQILYRRAFFSETLGIVLISRSLVALSQPWRYATWQGVR